MVFINTHTKGKETPVDRLVKVGHALVVRIKNYRLYSETMSELNSLTGRELADLGLTRSMIRSVAYSAVYERRDIRKQIR